jgi:flagellar export protein FliJ
MSFHFALNGLLRLRESLERAELQRLQSIAAAVIQARTEIELLETEMDAAQRHTFNTVLTAGMTGAALHFEGMRQDARNSLRSELFKKLSDLERRRKEQQERYMQARMQRKIISNLYERQRAEYDADQSRREQQRIDELFLIRSISPTKRLKAAVHEESI